MTDLRQELGILTPNEMQLKMDKEQNEAIEILTKLMNNEHVSRWDVFGRRHDLKRIMSTTDKYDSIRYEVEDLIASCKESL